MQKNEKSFYCINGTKGKIWKDSEEFSLKYIALEINCRELSKRWKKESIRILKMEIWIGGKDWQIGNQKLTFIKRA